MSWFTYSQRNFGTGIYKIFNQKRAKVELELQKNQGKIKTMNTIFLIVYKQIKGSIDCTDQFPTKAMLQFEPSKGTLLLNFNLWWALIGKKH